MHTQTEWAFFRLKDGTSLSRQSHLLVDAELVVFKDMLCAQRLVSAICQAFGGVFQTVSGVTTGPAIEIAHVRAQAGLLFDRNIFRVGVQHDFLVVRGDVGATAIAIEQVTIGFTIRANT
jgi:hypothetical protein